MDTFNRCLAQVQRLRPVVSLQALSNEEISPARYDRVFRIWRHAFCKEFVTKMPREIRDMVYGYILEPKYSVKIRYGIHDANVRFHNIKDAAKISPSLGSDGELLFSCWTVGQEFAFELASLFYKRATFDIIDPRDLEAVLSEDIFNVGIQPRDIIRSLRVHVWGDLQRGRWLNRENGNLTLQDLLLERLNDLRCKSVLAVEVRLHFSTIATCKQCLKNIAPLLYNLIEEGVDVQVSRQRGGEIGNWASMGMRRLYNLSGLLEGTSEQYVERVQKAGKFAKLGAENGDVASSDIYVRRRFAAAVVSL